MTEVDNTDHIVHSSEVKKAAQKLRAKKPDGENGLWSNNIKFGPNELFDHISKLLSAMLVHMTYSRQRLIQYLWINLGICQTVTTTEEQH